MWHITQPHWAITFEEMCPLKPHQNAQGTAEGILTQGKGISKCKSNMKFLIFCWHNTTNFNIMERERTHTHRAWKMIYCTHTHTHGGRERDNRRTQIQGQTLIFAWADAASLALTIWIQFRAELSVWFGYGSDTVTGWEVEVDLCPVTAEKKRKRKERAFGLFALREEGQDMCSSSLLGGHFALRCAINQRGSL